MRVGQPQRMIKRLAKMLTVPSAVLLAAVIANPSARQLKRSANSEEGDVGPPTGGEGQRSNVNSKGQTLTPTSRPGASGKGIVSRPRESLTRSLEDLANQKEAYPPTNIAIQVEPPREMFGHLQSMVHALIAGGTYMAGAEYPRTHIPRDATQWQHRLPAPALIKSLRTIILYHFQALARSITDQAKNSKDETYIHCLPSAGCVPTGASGSLPSANVQQCYCCGAVLLLWFFR